MRGYYAAALILLVACGTEDHRTRPKTLEYITTSILEPSCGTTQCHSEFTQAARRERPGTATRPAIPAIPLVFDTVENARATFHRDSSLIDNVNSDLRPTLIVNLTTEYADAPRMPFDAPIATDDLLLIRDWIEDGGPGVCLGESACHGSVERYCNDERAFDFEREPKGPCGL